MAKGESSCIIDPPVEVLYAILVIGNLTFAMRQRAMWVALLVCPHGMAAGEQVEPLSDDLVRILKTEVDLNGDGASDIFYEYEIDSLPGYYELVDRNFDGRIDESTYFSEEHVPIYGRADNDYNGLMDTVVEYQHSYVKVKWVDSNFNGTVDTVVEYKHGEIHKARRYRAKGEDQNQARIGTVTFKNMYPSTEKLETTEMSETEFQAKHKPIVSLTGDS